MKFTLESTRGGVGGAHFIIKYEGRYLGHFYPEYERYEDFEAFEKLLTTGEKPSTTERKTND